MTGEERSKLLQDAITMGIEASAIAKVVSRCLLDQIELNSMDDGFVTEISSALDACSRLMLEAGTKVDLYDLESHRRYSGKGGVNGRS